MNIFFECLPVLLSNSSDHKSLYPDVDVVKRDVDIVDVGVVKREVVVVDEVKWLVKNVEDDLEVCVVCVEVCVVCGSLVLFILKFVYSLLSFIFLC